MAEMAVGHYIIDVPEDYIDISVAVPAPPSSRETSNETMAEMAVGHYIINVPEDYIDISVAVPAPPSSREIKDKKQARMHVLKVVAVLLIVVSAIGIRDLSFGVGFYADSDEKFLLKVYATVILTTFESGMGLLFISMVLVQVPISVAIAMKLVWAVVAFVNISLCLVEFGGLK